MPDVAGLRLFKRGCSVTLITPSALPAAFFDHAPGPENAIEITGLRIKFEIEKHVKSDPNRCDIQVFNLAQNSRALCEKKPLTVWLDAGYDGELRQVFRGDVRHAYSELKKPEWVTTLQLGDGDRACRLARVNKSYASGTPALTVVKDLARSMGLTVSDADAARLADLRTQPVGGLAVQGASRDAMTRVLAPFGVQWSIQNGRLQLLRDQDITDGTAALISVDTGMIGTPEYKTPVRAGKPPHLKVKTLLYPQLLPGTLILVRSRAIKDQYFRIQRLVHRGDTHGKEWETEIEAFPAQPGNQTTATTPTASKGLGVLGLATSIAHLK